MTDTTTGRLHSVYSGDNSKFIELLGRAVAVGDLTITTPQNKAYRFAGTHKGPQADLKILKSGFARKLLTGGDVGFAEAFIEEICDSDDLTALIELGAQNEHVSWSGFLKGRQLYRWFARVGHALRPNSRRGAKRNIKSHYDLG
ncbi:MAG TPA: hypothetical protein DCE33_13010, partial [Rhodospirillaceae bacterium]|nr:hypothetical protein [Rhodospirillaceae bacterium]